MIIAEYTVAHPLLRQTLNRVTGISVDWENSYTRPNGPMQILAWVTCDDFEEFESAVSDDPSATNPTVLTSVDGRSLYRLDYAGESRETSVMTMLMDLGGGPGESYRHE